MGKLGWADRERRPAWTEFQWGDSRGYGYSCRCSWVEVVGEYVGKGEEKVLGRLGEGGEGPGEGSNGSYFSSGSETRVLLLTPYTIRLQVTLDKNFSERVASAPMTVCHQLERLEKKRREELTELESQVDRLLRDSRNLHLG